MTLTTEPNGIGKHAVEEICKLEDPVYRNCWITYGYYDISRRLRVHIGNNASWCTFARWSSATVGESLRLDLDSRRLSDVFKRWPLRLFSEMAQDVYRDARAISDAAMPRTLAQGNHFVFHEIGHAVAEFLEWFEPRADDLAAAAPDVLRHRLILRPEAELERYRPDDAVQAALQAVPIPR